MPKRTDVDMQARRALILTAAKRCFTEQGFRGTSIVELAREAGVSSGNIYTHFKSKHEILEAISGEASEPVLEGELDLLALFEHLQSPEGLKDAQLDLNLWSEATRDTSVSESTTSALDQFKRNLRSALPCEKRTPGWLALFEALVLGLEVQRALERRGPSKKLLEKELLREV